MIASIYFNNSFKHQVAANPFRDWAHLSVRAPAKALRADFFTAGTSNAIPNPVGRPPNRNKRKEPCKFSK